MRPADNMNKLIKKLHVSASAKLDERVHSEISRALEKSERTKSAKLEPKIWRIIMKTRTSKIAAVAIVVIVMLSLSYGATKIIKYFTIDGMTLVVKNSNNINNEEDARKAVEEFGKLYRAGKAREVKPGVWVVTLSNGEEFAYGGNNPELVGLPEAEKKELLKKQSDEIQELRKAGKYERTFIKEIEENGVKIRLYRDRFTLSNGKVVTITFGEGQSPDEKNEK